MSGRQPPGRPGAARFLALQSLHELLRFCLALIGEPVEVANELLVVKLAGQLAMPLGQFAKKLHGLLHDAATPLKVR
jgi:hypothetical protein